MSLPLKSLLLKSFKTNEEMWDYDAVESFLNTQKIRSDYWKWNARFWLSELSVAGFLIVTDTELDDGNRFEKGRVLSKYKLTERGKDTIEKMLED